MRSLLFVPADSERKLARGLESGADALILDLEDSVAAANRGVARKQAREFLHTVVAVFLLAYPLGAAEVVRILDELRAVAKMPIASSVTIAGSNR